MRRRPPGVLYRTDVDPPAAVPPSPVVVREAARLGIDPGAVRGHGVGGRVRLADLAPPPVPAALPRAVAVTEADVTALLPAGPGELLARVAAVVLSARPVAGGLSVTVPDAGGALVASLVPDATELSIPGLTRAIARAQAHRSPGGTGLTVHDAGDDGLLLELPVVEPVPALLLSVGAPRRELVPDGSGGGLTLAVRWSVRLAAVSEPARVPRGVATALLRAASEALEQGR